MRGCRRWRRHVNLDMTAFAPGTRMRPPVGSKRTSVPKVSAAAGVFIPGGNKPLSDGPGLLGIQVGQHIRHKQTAEDHAVIAFPVCLDACSGGGFVQIIS